MPNNKITVVMATYNHADYVREAINSVLSQKNVDFEFLITDDGSTDKTQEIISSVADPRIVFYPNKVNRGACVVTNELINRASGDYIALINSDDYWSTSDKLEQQLSYMQENKNVGACFGKAKFVDKMGVEIPKSMLGFGSVFDKENRSRGKWLRYFFDNGNCICHPSMLIRKSCYDELGLYNNRLRQLPDFDMWIRLVKKYDIHIFDQCFINFRIMPGENASSQTPENKIRNMNENFLIANSFFDDVDEKLIKDGFSDVLKNSEIPDLQHLDIEKTMLYFLKNLSFHYIYGVVGLNRIFSLLNEPSYANILETEYGIDDRWFQKMTGSFNILPSSSHLDIDNLSQRLNMIVNSTSWRITAPMRYVATILKKIKISCLK